MPGEAATEALGARLAATLPANPSGLLIALEGDLGAGKTTLVRAFLRALGHAGPVPSPSYTLVEPYELDRGRYYHVDLYRLADAGELEFLGWSDLREGVVLVEWPERAPEILASSDLSIKLAYRGTGRGALLESHGAAGERWLRRAAAAESSSINLKLCP